jgi:PAS domain S-box-containing protein
MVYAQDRDAVTEQAARVIAGETTAPLEHRIVHRDGFIRWVRNTSVPYYDEHRRLVAYDGLITNITEHKRAEEALRDSEERYRTLVASATDMIFIAQDGMVKFPNPASSTITGYSEEELSTLPFANIIHPEEREMVIEKHTRRLKGEEVPNTYSFRILTKGGEVLWVQLNAVLITWEGRHGVLCSLRDITPQKRLEEQYLHAQKMEAVGTLAGGVAHDFNNLLQAVLGNAQMFLMEKKADDPGYQQMVAIKQAAQRGAELTQRLLTFSRKVQSKPKVLNLNQEVMQVEKLLRRTIPKMIEVELRLSGDLWAISADPVQMGQVIMNLALNARDAMPEGGKLVIGTKNVALGEEFCKSHVGLRAGSYVLLSVSDTGQGMGKEVLQHLFEPFFTTKEVGRGTGLGLAMVYGIVKGHEGYIECESELGKGSIFKIYFLAVEQAVEEEEAEEEERPRGGRETILLVDDEESLRDLAKEILSTFGYTVITASDGEGALKIYRREKDKIHLIILDVIMPGMGGMRCLEGLQSIDPEVKVVIATGYSPEGEGQAKAVLEGEAGGYISKPYDMRELLRVVREALDK